MTRSAVVVRVAAALVALSALGCTGSTGRPPEFTGAIAFNGRGQHLFTVDAADSTTTRVGQRESSEAPAWSPDGATIVYSTPGGEVIVADASGGDERRFGRHWCYLPVFSPDGSRLACELTEPWVITVVDASDGALVARTPDCCYRPAWSPDGRQIAYLSFGTYDPKSGRYLGPSGVFVMNADGTHRRLVARTTVDGGDATPAWSSLGAIAFLRDGAIWTVNAAGKGLRRLVSADARAQEGLVWSRDGEKLAFGGGDGDYEVFVVNADGSGLENLTNNQKIQDRWPSWSPDRKAIAFVSNRDDGLDQIFAMRADGSGETQLTHDDGWRACCPTWSPVVS